MRQIVLLLLSLFTCYTIHAQCTSDRYKDTVFHHVTVTSGIQFGRADTYLGIPQDLSLDFYEPTGDTLSNRPLLVYAFGGGFLIGVRGQPPIPAYCTYFAQCGYAVASIDYRIGFNPLDQSSAERAVYRGAQDLRAAVRFLCQRYSQYRIDTTAIFLTGSSAGCFSGLHSCFMEQADCPTSVHGSTFEPSDLGCFDCSGNTDNNQRMPKIRGIVNHWGAILDTIFMRTTAKDNVPVISFQGDGDNVVPYVSGHPFSYPVFPVVYGALPIHRRLDNIGIKNELHTFVGFGHEPWLLSPELKDTCYKYTKPFLYGLLKPIPLTITGDSTLCLNGMGIYTVASRTGSKYCWTVSGGTITAQNNNQITVKWTSAGTHTITVQELSRNEVNGDVFSFTVHILSHPVANFTDSIIHSNVIFTDHSVGASTWHYTFGDSTTSAIANPIHNYHNASTYTATLIVSNGYCADTTTNLIYTDTCPVASFHYLVSNDTVYFIADPTNTIQFHWHFGDGDSTDGSTAYHVYSHSQNYLVSLAVASSNCQASTNNIIHYTAPATTGIDEIDNNAIKVYPNPAHSFIYPVCDDCTVTIYDALGRIVLNNNGDNRSNLDISTLNAGIYSLRIATRNKIAYSRLVVQ